MALSKQYALDQIRHTLGRETSRRVDALDVLNQAGHHYYGVREWLHARRPAVELSFVADEKLVNLPTDFGTLLAITAVNGLNNGFELITPGELDLYRSSTLGENHVYRGAIVGQVAEDSSVVDALEVYPTPTEDSESALLLRYRAGWVNVTDETEVLPLPASGRSLYLQYVRAFARGIEQEDIAGLEPRLREIDGGALFRQACRQDTAGQRVVGRLRNGASAGFESYRYLDRYVEGPSGP